MSDSKSAASAKAHPACLGVIEDTSVKSLQTIVNSTCGKVSSQKLLLLLTCEGVCVNLRFGFQRLTSRVLRVSILPPGRSVSIGKSLLSNPSIVLSHSVLDASHGIHNSPFLALILYSCPTLWLWLHFCLCLIPQKHQYNITVLTSTDAAWRCRGS